MGYYTTYSLEIENEYKFESDLELKVFESLARITDLWNEADVEAAAECHYPLNVISYESLKWYNHKQDMIELSKMFPLCRFILEGQGEEPDDMWREYYLNGYCQVAYARIEYDEPDWDMLKSFSAEA